MRRTEPRCPFCSCEARGGEENAPLGALSRAALVALGVGVAGSEAAAQTQGARVPPAGISAYGIAPARAADRTLDTGVGVPAYGMPPSSVEPTAQGTVSLESLMVVRGRSEASAPEPLRALLLTRLGSFRSCYLRSLRANPELAGRLALSFRVNADGTVAEALSQGPELEGALAACMRSMLQRVRFQPLATGVALEGVRLRLVVHPGAEAPQPAPPPSPPSRRPAPRARPRR